MFIKILFISIIIILIILWICGVVFQFLMIRNRKSEIRIFDRRILFNPFNIQFFGEKYLTKEGCHWRNKSWLCFGVFVVTIIIILSLKKIFY